MRAVSTHRDGAGELDRTAKVPANWSLRLPPSHKAEYVFPSSLNGPHGNPLGTFRPG